MTRRQKYCKGNEVYYFVGVCNFLGIHYSMVLGDVLFPIFQT